MEYERVFEPELCNKPAAGDIDGSSALREVFSIGPIRAVHQGLAYDVDAERG